MLVSSAPHRSWPQAALRWTLTILTALARRPLQTVTVIVAIALLAASVGEAQAANRLESQVAQAHAHNAALQTEIRHIDAEIADDSTPAAIIAHARRLGYVPASTSQS